MTPTVRFILALVLGAVALVLAFIALDGFFPEAEDGDKLAAIVAIGAAFLGLTILHAP